jgi:hypothetical protein
MSDGDVLALSIERASEGTVRRPLALWRNPAAKAGSHPAVNAG